MSLLTKRKLKLNSNLEEAKNDEIVLDDDEIESFFEVKKKTKPICINKTKKVETPKKNLKKNKKEDTVSIETDETDETDDSEDEIIFENSITVEKISDSPVKETIIETSFIEQDEILIETHKFVKNINLKFRFKGSIHCVNFKSNDKFKDKLDELSKILNISSDKILLMINDEMISMNRTPDELNLSVVDMIIVLEKKSDITSSKEENYGPFKVKFRDCDSRRKTQDITLNMHQNDKFEEVFSRYASLKNLDLNDIIFEFDGETVKLNETPECLDMESDSLIDVKIKKK